MFALLNGLSDRMMMVIITAQLMTILNGETRPGSRIEQTHLTHSQFGQMGPTKLHITGKQAQPKTSENVTVQFLIVRVRGEKNKNAIIEFTDYQIPVTQIV